MTVQSNAFLGTAVNAPQIAAVGNGNAQIIYLSTVFIEHHF
jgi:hypothetical protein